MGPGAWHLRFFSPPSPLFYVSCVLSLWHLIGCGPGFTNCRLACNDTCACFPGIREVRSGCLPYQTHARCLQRLNIMLISIFILLLIHFSSCPFVLSLCHSFPIHVNWNPVLTFFHHQGASAVVGAWVLS